MAKVYSLELPDKRVIDIEAPDEASAMQAADDWFKANPYKVAKTMPAQDPRITDLQRPGPAQRMLSMVPGLGGALDEIGAAGDAAFNWLSGGRTGEDYDTALARRRQLIKEDDAKGGAQYYADKGLGIAATVAATPMLNLFGRGGSVVGAGADAGLSALGYGAAEGFTSGEGELSNRIQNATQTGGTSAAFAAPIGGVGRMIGNRLAGTAGTVVDDAAALNIQMPRFMGNASRPEEFLGAKLGAIPFVGDDINAAVVRTREQTGQAARNISDSVTGGRVTPQNAGETVRGSMMTWADDTARQIQERAYGPLNQLMQGTVSPLAQTRQAAQALAQDQAAAANPIHARALQEIDGALQNVVAGQGNAQGRQGLTFEGLTMLRTRIGQLIDNKIDPENRTARAGLERIYGALSRDMEAVIRAQGGPRAVAQWQRANRISQQIAERRDTIARIVGSEGEKAGENIVDRLVAMASTKSSADARRLIQARNVAGGEAWGELSAAAIDRLGRNQSNEFSAAIFLKNYSQLSDEGRRILFRSTGNQNLQRDLDRLASVAQRLQQFDRLGNPSGTGGVAAVMTAIAGMGMGDAGATAGTMMASRGLGYLMSRPAVVRQVSQYAQAYERFLQDPRTRAAMTNAGLLLAKTVAQETGEDPRDIQARLTVN